MTRSEASYKVEIVPKDGYLKYKLMTLKNETVFCTIELDVIEDFKEQNDKNPEYNRMLKTFKEIKDLDSIFLSTIFGCIYISKIVFAPDFDKDIKAKAKIVGGALHTLFYHAIEALAAVIISEHDDDTLAILQRLYFYDLSEMNIDEELLDEPINISNSEILFSTTENFLPENL